MLRELKIKNFKCFEELTIEFDSLNIFSGINSMGKSTIIQALLLLRQAYEMNSINKGIYLNGNTINLGTGYDVLYRRSQDENITISLSGDMGESSYTYEYNRDSDFQRVLTKENNEGFLNENLFGENFAYISAERNGPQRFYESSYHEVIENNQVGCKGEYFAAYLAERGTLNKVTNSKVLYDGINTDILIFQMEAWMSEISPGLHFNPKKYTEAGIVGMEYTVAAEGHTPINVGFGISYVAPIVLSLLKAQPGDLVILENPEAHLHPKAQRKMGELISKAASGGVQIIVETHSDHLLNGIRLSVKNKVIDRRNTRLNYFYTKSLNENNEMIMMHEKCSPVILDDGSLSDWPDGFFDEWDKALEDLF